MENIDHNGISGNPKSILYLDSYSTSRDKTQLPEESPNFCVNQRLAKRAERKAKSLSMFQELAGLNNESRGQYERAIRCGDIIEVSPDRILKTWNYCNHRLCAVCHAIRQARYIDKYSAIIEGDDDWYFLTLTLPAIAANDLRERIDQMLKEFTCIVNAIKKHNSRNNPTQSVNAMRKIEIGYSVQAGYTPHFHLLVEGKEIAELILKEWLQRFPDTFENAQDLKHLKEEGELKEFFGYAIKLTVDSNRIPTENLDTILAALKNKRTFQTYGKFYGVKVEEDPNKKSESYRSKDLSPGRYQWDEDERNWIDRTTGVLLVN